jgi:hypothetical protein
MKNLEPVPCSNRINVSGVSISLSLLQTSVKSTDCYTDQRVPSHVLSSAICLMKKVPERRSDLRPSEKELSERRSGAFRHKNTPGFIQMWTLLV